MQFAHPPIVLPSSEYARLQRLMLTMIGSGSTLASILRRKLGASVPVPASSVATEVALSGMRVRFRIDGKSSDERVLTWQPPRRGHAARLSLRSARGLALLGLSPGASIFYRTERDTTEHLEVEHVSQATDRSVHQRARLLADDTSGARSSHVEGVPLAAPESALAGRQHA